MVEQKSRINRNMELLLFPDLFPRFSQVARNIRFWKTNPHTSAKSRPKDTNLAARMASRRMNVANVSVWQSGYATGLSNS
jgi:hypothetical protein